MNDPNTQPLLNLWLAIGAGRGGAERKCGREPGWSFSHPHPGHVCARVSGGRGQAARGPAPSLLETPGPYGRGSGPGFGCGPGVVAGAAAGKQRSSFLVVCVCASSPSCCKAFSCRRDSWGPQGGGIRGRKRKEGGSAAFFCIDF